MPALLPAVLPPEFPENPPELFPPENPPAEREPASHALPPEPPVMTATGLARRTAVAAAEGLLTPLTPEGLPKPLPPEVASE
jgi:hypothetical protein